MAPYSTVCIFTSVEKIEIELTAFSFVILYTGLLFKPVWEDTFFNFGKTFVH